jgi:hypothetical protein
VSWRADFFFFRLDVCDCGLGGKEMARFMETGGESLVSHDATCMSDWSFAFLMGFCKEFMGDGVLVSGSGWVTMYLSCW